MMKRTDVQKLNKIRLIIKALAFVVRWRLFFFLHFLSSVRMKRFIHTRVYDGFRSIDKCSIVFVHPNFWCFGASLKVLFFIWRLFFLFDATTLVEIKGPVPPQWAWLSYTNFITDGRYIQCTPYRGPTLHKWLERMTSALLSPTSWRLYHESCGLTTVI